MGEEKKRILRWMGIFSLPWAVLGILLWLAARPAAVVPGSETVVEGFVEEFGADGETEGFLRPARSYLVLRSADGTRARYPEADRGAVIPEGFSAGDYARVTLAREKGGGRQVFVKIEPGS